jgi:hypothetical protein
MRPGFSFGTAAGWLLLVDVEDDVFVFFFLCVSWKFFGVADGGGYDRPRRRH